MLKLDPSWLHTPFTESSSPWLFLHLCFAVHVYSTYFNFLNPFISATTATYNDKISRAPTSTTSSNLLPLPSHTHIHDEAFPVPLPSTHTSLSPRSSLPTCHRPHDFCSYTYAHCEWDGPSYRVVVGHPYSSKHTSYPRTYTKWSVFLSHLSVCWPASIKQSEPTTASLNRDTSPPPPPSEYETEIQTGPRKSHLPPPTIAWYDYLTMVWVIPVITLRFTSNLYISPLNLTWLTTQDTGKDKIKTVALATFPSRAPRRTIIQVKKIYLILHSNFMSII